jgi:hypothetical protein
MTQLPYSLFTGFFVHHLPVSYQKSSFEAVWAAEPDLLARACSHRFRDDRDVNQWIVQFWQYCTGTFAPRSPKIGSMYEGASLMSEAVADISSGRHKMVCWNDSADMEVSEIDSVQFSIVSAFDVILPVRSSFERT